MSDSDGYTAFFVREEAHVGIYDIYYMDEWVAQIRWNRVPGRAVGVLSRPEIRAKHKCLSDISGRDQWKAWLQQHQGKL